MNLPKFLKFVDKEISEMCVEQLKFLVHETARTLPENQRDIFIEKLNSIKISKNGNEKNNRQDREDYETLLRDIEHVTGFLNAINDGEYSLGSDINYRNDDWYDDNFDFIFSDPENILPIIDEAINLLDRCIDLEAYNEGAELAALLSRLTVDVDGEYRDYNGSALQIDDLFDEDLLEGSKKEFAKKALFLIYNGVSLPDRPASLYNFICSLNNVDVKFEDVMQLGDQDLPDFDKFLPLWIEYLGNQKDTTAGKLLDEALTMAGEDHYLDAAEKFSASHPQLYKHILQNGLSSKSNEEMMKIGLEALEKIRNMSGLRENIALMTADYAIKIKDQATAEQCWLEAFRSNQTAENYLRIRFFSGDYGKYAEQVRNIYEDFREQGCKERAYGNETKHKAYCAILFFEKRFEEVMTVGMNAKFPLGWTDTFMKEGLALFFILLYQGEYIPPGLRAMYENVLPWMHFDAKKLLAGTVYASEVNPEDMFWELFHRWKSETEIPVEDYSHWMHLMGEQISRRVEGIMQASRTKYYEECAAFIAAYGEVLDSKNEAGREKAVIMEQYRREYPRRRIFIQALREYGMTS